jgi:hypothetical protein
MELKKETINSLAVYGETLVASGKSSIYLFDIKNHGKNIF